MAEDIKRGDEIEFFDLYHLRLWGKALRDLAEGQEVIEGESLTTPGLIVPVQLADIVSVHRVPTNEDPLSYSEEKTV